MPPRKKTGARARGDATDSPSDAPESKKPRVAKAKKNGPYKMPPPLPAGEVLTDHFKHSWVLGESVGKGGFGEIYRAAPAGKSASAQNADHVIKIEPEENGPLFTELAFYCRVAKAETIDRWVSSHPLSYLAIPKYISQGKHTHGKVSYRFMVMPCFGEDVEKKFELAGRQFGTKTVCHLALRLLEALEFLHSSEYAHGDIKGSNLLTGRQPSQQHEVHLVDYGLAYRYSPEGTPKEYKEDPRRKHDGTLEFTSIDAHKGVMPSPRGDLEILGYCLLQWSAGRLPWEGTEDKDWVAQQKIRYKSDLGALLKTCFPSSPAPKSLRDYMSYVYSLDYRQTPNYTKMVQMFRKELSGSGWKDDGKNLDWMVSGKKRKISDGVDGSSSPKKAKPETVAKQKKKPAATKPAVTKPAATKPRAKPRAAKPASVSPEKSHQLEPTSDEPTDDHTDRASGGTIRKTKAKTTRGTKAKITKGTKAETNGRTKPGTSDGHPMLLPQVSYPSELGYSVGGDKVEVVRAIGRAGKAAGKSTASSPLAKRRTVKRLQKASPATTATKPRKVPARRGQQRVATVDSDNVSDSDEDYFPKFKT